MTMESASWSTRSGQPSHPFNGGPEFPGGRAGSLEDPLCIGVAFEAGSSQAGMVPLDGIWIHVASRPVRHGPGRLGRIPEHYPNTQY